MPKTPSRTPDDAVIVSAVRTPIGKFKGTLTPLSAPQLGAVAIEAAVRRSAVEPTAVNEVLMGNVVLAGQGQAPARQAGIKAGLPVTVGATTVNKVCGSGLKTVMLAAAMITAGQGDVFVAGGMESMNNSPYLLSKARFGYRLGNGELIDALVHDGLWCPSENHHMGNSAEWIAQEYGLTREELDEYAYRSHMRAIAAIDEGRFDEEIVPVEVPQRRGEPKLFTVDESPRRDTSLEALARLKPAFQRDGIVTAGNSPGITDGAAATVVMKRSSAEARGIEPLARIVAYDQAAVEPLKVFTAPIFAVRKLLEKTGTTTEDYDLFEVNEAFAAQMLADMRELDLPEEKVNVNGGAIALGHPIGCSGTRVLVTLLHALKDRGLERGLAALCLGGGEAVAMSIELE
jgi:acetyl-CoA C-acetyltransferase